MNLPPRFAVRRLLLNRSPELAGATWLVLLAAAIWTHTHATQQAPIYDAFSYYWKAYNFWAGVHAGIWFNPLNIQPTFRPPGTILMSYPLGFNQDPRGFYFRSVYMPLAMFFLAVLITAYQARDDLWSRGRAVLTAIFFTSITLPYHFEAGTPGGLIWGLADPFLSGLAAVAAASVWRASRLDARILAWAIVTCLASTLAIIVKPSGTLVAAAAGFGWVAFGLASLIEHRLIEHRWTSEWRARTLRFLFGAVIIGAGDTATVIAALNSGYLSPQNMAFGKGAIALMRQMDFPASQLWFLLNNGIGRGLLLWVGLVCLAVMFSSGRAIRTVRSIMALIASVCIILFGVWFWFVGSGGAAFVRYAVPFFAMGFIWLVPVSLDAWRLAPLLLRGTLPAVMAATMVNLALLLLVPRPSLAWQQFGGVGIAADFPQVALTAFKALVAQPSQHPRSIYIVTLDTSGAILGSFIDQTHLFDPADNGVWVVRRPLDWQRSATFRLNEIASADALMVNPQQSDEAPTGRYVANLLQEQGVITMWADGLTEADGVKVFFSSPTIKILDVVDHAKLRAALERMVAAHAWDPTFLTANRAG